MRSKFNINMNIIPDAVIERLSKISMTTLSIALNSVSKPLLTQQPILDFQRSVCKQKH